MNRIYQAAVLTAALLCAGTAPATVVSGSNYTFNFTGTCTDCSGTDTAQLKLTNYVLGSAVNTGNFVSFHFDGSNLYKAFDITQPFIVSGSFTTTSSSTASFFVTDTSNFFSSDVSGSWQLGNSSLIADFGTAGRYVSATTSSAAPEPASWAMMIGGFGLVGAAMRRRSLKVSWA